MLWLMDQGDNWVIKAKRFKKRAGEIFRGRLRSLLRWSQTTHRQVVIEAGIFQIALIRPSASVINQKYRMNGEVEEYNSIPEDGRNLYCKGCFKPGNICSIHLLNPKPSHCRKIKSEINIFV